MRTTRVSPRVALLAATATTAALGAGTAAALQPSADPAATPRVPVSSLVRGLSAATDLGPSDPATPVTVDLVLQRPDPAGEQAELHALYDPASPEYRHFLTPAAFRARFGVPQDRVDAATRWATSAGLHLLDVSTGGDVVQLTGRLGDAARLLGTTEHDFRGSDGTTFFANTGAATVPSGLGVTGVVGLNSRDRSRTTSSGPHAQVGRRPAQTTCQPTGQCVGLVTPQDLWSVYDQPDSDKGAGQQLAVFGEGKTDPVVKNLRRFEQVHGLRRVNVDVVPTDDDFADNSGEVEWDLDTQSSTGMAPDVQREVLYFGKDLSDASVLTVFSRWASDPTGPLQANASYSECEEAPGNQVYNQQQLPVGTAGKAYTDASEATLRMAVMQGKTLFSSTGDTGGSCYYGGADVNGVANTVVPLVAYPASSPYVVGVGGTVLYTDGGPTGDGTQQPAQRALEYAWPYTGGGTSPFRAAPAYQGLSTGVAPSRCVSDPDGNPSGTGVQCRGVPDVAALSGDIATNGYAITEGGSDANAGGGTSLSSPLTMGMWARVQATAPLVGGRKTGLGFANEVFYRNAADATKDARDFYDVSTGSNGQYQALPRVPGANPTGWDYVSGLGVLDVKHLVEDTTGRLTPVDPALPADRADVFQPCDPTGAITDAAGDATSVAGLAAVPVSQANDPGLDVTRATVETDRAVQRLTFRITVASLKDALYPAQFFRDDFSFGGSKFELQLERFADGSTSYSLVSPAATVGGSTTTVIASLDDGAFDEGASQVRASFGVAAFNAAVAKAKVPVSGPLRAASQLTDLSVLAQRPANALTGTGVLLTADSADNGGCPFTLGARGTTGGSGSGAGGPVLTRTSAPLRFHPLGYRALATVGTRADRTGTAVAVLGRAGVPRSATAVLLQVAGDRVARRTPLEVGPGDRSTAPAVTYDLRPGRAVRDLVLVRPDRAGRLRLTTTGSAARVQLRVVGWYAPGQGDGYRAIGERVTPARGAVVGAGHDVVLRVVGRGGLRPGQTDAVALAVRVSAVRLPRGRLADLGATVGGTAATTAVAQLAAAAGEPATDVAVVARPDRRGEVHLRLPAGSARVDVVETGQWATAAATASRGTATAQQRVVAPAVAADVLVGSRPVLVGLTGARGVPAGATGVVLQVASGAPTGGPGEVLVGPAGGSAVSAVATPAGARATQLLLVRPGRGGAVAVRAARGGPARVRLTVLGYQLG